MSVTPSVAGKGISFQQKIQIISKDFFDTRSRKTSKHSEIERAFTNYYNALNKLVYNISIRVLHDNDLANENVSKVFMKMYQNVDFVFDNSKSHLSYIWTVTHNSALMMFNKIKKDKLIPESRLRKNLESDETENLLDIIYAKNDGEFDTIDFDFSYLHNSTEKKHDKIIDIINSLPDNNPEIMIDALVHGIEYEKIAKKHGLRTAGAIKTKVFRAKKTIIKELEKDVMTEKLMDGEKVSGEVKIYYKKTRFQQIKYIATLRDGKLNGKFIKYHKNGEIAIEGTHMNGKLNGEYKEFYMNSNLKLIGTYADGVKDGEWKRFNEDGSFNRRNDYINGEVAFYEFVDEDGELKSGIVDERMMEDEADVKNLHIVEEELTEELMLA